MFPHRVVPTLLQLIETAPISLHMLWSAKMNNSKALETKCNKFNIYNTSACKRVNETLRVFWDKVCTLLRVQTWQECVDMCIVIRMCWSARSSLQLSFAWVECAHFLLVALKQYNYVRNHCFVHIRICMLGHTQFMGWNVRQPANSIESHGSMWWAFWSVKVCQKAAMQSYGKCGRNVRLLQESILAMSS